MLTAVVGDIGASFGDTAAVIGIGRLYVLTFALLASLFTRPLGVGAIFAVILALVALNFPSGGGSVPGSMLPPFWQVLHESWIGAGALESMRSVVYFGGEQVGRWMLQLGIWTAAIAILVTRRRSCHPSASRC